MTSSKNSSPCRPLFSLCLLFVLAAAGGDALAVFVPWTLPDNSTMAEELSRASTAEPASTDLWDRVRRNFSLPQTPAVHTEQDVRWYERNPLYMRRIQQRAGRYLHHIVAEAERRGIPGEIALLPALESAFQPFAYSPGQAAGLWQFIPVTGRRFGLRQNWWYDGRRDIQASTQAAFSYLERLHRDFGGDWLLALAGYNAGEGRVQRAIARNRKAGQPEDFWSLELPGETRNYVPRLLALARVVSEPEAHGIVLEAIPDEPYFEAVDTGSQIDLAVAARLAELDLNEVYLLNPGFNRWATDPQGPHRLLVPVAHAERLRAGIGQMPAEERIQWRRHRIENGETLSHIAHRYRTTVSTLRTVNKLTGDRIRAGRYLLIPVASAEQDEVYRLSLDGRPRRQQARKRDGAQVTYAVRNGDTLWDIARAHGVGFKQLAIWNGLAPDDAIRPGQMLVVWSRQGKAGGVTAVAAGGVQALTRQAIRYTVRPGDSLDRISRKFRVSVKDLRRWNARGLKGRYIHPGQKLTLYLDVTRQAL